MDINEYVKNWQKKAAHLRPSEDELNSIGLQTKLSNTHADTLVVGPELAKKWSKYFGYSVMIGKL
eukprot:1351060-Rhodomonas_salina.1